MNIPLAWLKRLAAFCRAQGAPHYYRDWSGLTLLEYLNFHAQQNTLQVVGDGQWEMANGRWGLVELAPPILGIGIAWQDHSAWVRPLLAAGRKDYFHWQRTDPAGDCLVLSDFIATAPGVLARLARQGRARFPGWADKKLLLLRHRAGRERFTEYTAETVRRLLRPPGQTEGHLI